KKWFNQQSQRRLCWLNQILTFFLWAIRVSRHLVQALRRVSSAIVPLASLVTTPKSGSDLWQQRSEYAEGWSLQDQHSGFDVDQTLASPARSCSRFPSAAHTGRDSRWFVGVCVPPEAQPTALSAEKLIPAARSLPACICCERHTPDSRFS